MNFLIAVNFLSASWFVWRMSGLQHVGFMTLAISLALILKFPMTGIVTASLVIAIEPLNNAIDEILYRNSRDRWLSEWVQRMIFEMKGGRSYRSALGFCAKENPENLFQRKLSQRIQRDGLGNLAEDIWWKKVDMELYQIESSQHKAIEKLCSWRDRIKIESDFRRKMGQVTMQIRAQAMLLLFFYLALLLFSAAKEGSHASLTLLLMSFLLFSLGFFLIFWLGRRVKWSF